jgi:predicted dehydrogenase
VSRPLGVAVVGVGATQWSGAAHLPAIAATPGVKLSRLVTSNDESARRAQEAWDVPASAQLQDALHDPRVDIVTITLRVARHAEIAEAAVSAGKNVYCEWPLALDTSEAIALESLSAKHSGAVHVVGLQGRLAPEFRAAATAIADGRIGRPLRASASVQVPQGLQPRPRHRAHLRHRSASANVLSIQGGHVLDVLVSMLGAAGDVQFSQMWTAVDEFTVLETGERLPRDAPDNVVTQLEIGRVPVTVQLSQTSARSGTVIEVLGTAGSIRLVGPDQPQMSAVDGTLTELGGETVALVPEHFGGGLDRAHPGSNVALLYADISRAIAGDTGTDLPTFERAVSMHRLLDAIERRAQS